MLLRATRVAAALFFPYLDSDSPLSCLDDKRRTTPAAIPPPLRLRRGFARWEVSARGYETIIRRGRNASNSFLPLLNLGTITGYIYRKSNLII